MNRFTSKRIGFGLVQHMALALAVFTIVSVAHNLVISVENLYGETKRHQLDLYEGKERFEDTKVFGEMFDSAVSDLTTLVVIKGQLEENGEYDGEKLIDVTAFVNRREEVSSCPITAVFYLDDLVKWGKNGLSMAEKTFTKKEFVNFFGDGLLGIRHFYLDAETGNLRYRGELTEMESQEGMEAEEITRTGNELEEQIADAVKLQEVYDNYLEYNEDRLVDMAFSYLASHMDKPVTLSLEDGEELVHLEMLRPRYATIDGELQLVYIADNWIDYCSLENNLIDTIESIGDNYALYESRNDVYSRGNTNLSYLVRVPTEEGYIDYTNMPEEYLTEDTGEIDNYFEDIGKYISYSVDDINCVGNADISSEEMLRMVETHEYAYPPGTRIWIGVDTDFKIAGDQFEIGYRTYEGIVPRMNEVILAVCLCLAVWLFLLSYLSYSAGRKDSEKGELTWYLNGFDRLYTEFVAALAVLLGYIGYVVFSMLMALALETDHAWLTMLYPKEHSGSMAHYLPILSLVYGFVVSFLFSIFWFSMVRRIKAGNLWKDSFLHKIWEKCSRGIAMVIYHRSTTIRTLIPYNLFLVVNVFGLAGVAVFEARKYLVFAIVACLLIFDAMVGMILFRRNAEMAEIVAAIKRIRLGEADCRLEAERMHGENREIAEAVNRIGEGIQNAVATSMKDERMKTELITNVSHDIKTPLTSIINYVDLLKRQKLEEEPVKTYIDILDSKSQRLKQLTDDLVEASKISSGNIVLEKEKLDLAELLNQSLGEFSEKFEERELQILFESNISEAYIYADSRRMWRVIENLFNNIYKYAMPSSRVYINMEANEGYIEVSMKNMSRMQLNIKSDELTERFIRGDMARATEGSGLGLSIAKSLTQVQGGTFEVYLDGDLFKVTVSFPEFDESEDGNQN